MKFGTCSEVEYLLISQPYHQHTAVKEEVITAIPEAYFDGLNRGKLTVNKKVRAHVDHPFEIQEMDRKIRNEYTSITRVIEK